MKRATDAGAIQLNENDYTSAKPQTLPDAYMSGGLIGVIVTFFLFGWLSTKISLWCEKLFGGYEIGSIATDFSLKNVDNKNVSLKDYKDAKGFIVIFTCNHCPYAIAYEDRIIDLDKKYKKLGYPVIAINPNNPEKQNWIIVGDLNDYPDDKTSLKKLLNSKWMENIVQTRITDPAEQWTHYWDTTSVPIDERYKQIDYIFLSKKLATTNPAAVPVIIRKGLITKATLYTGPRFTDVTDKQGASDHCPVAITLKL